MTKTLRHNAIAILLLIVSAPPLANGDEANDQALKSRVLAELPSRWTALETAVTHSQGTGTYTEYHVSGDNVLTTRVNEFAFRLQRQSRLFDVRPVVRKSYDRKNATLVDPPDLTSRPERTVLCVCPGRSFELRWGVGAQEPYIASAAPSEDSKLGAVIENGFKFGIDLMYGRLYDFRLFAVVEKPYSTWSVEKVGTTDDESLLKIGVVYNLKQYWNDRSAAKATEPFTAAEKLVDDHMIPKLRDDAMAKYWFYVSPAHSWAVCRFGNGEESDPIASNIAMIYADGKAPYPRLKEVVFSHPQKESVKVVEFRDFDVHPQDLGERAFTLEAYGLPDDVYRSSRSWQGNPVTWLFTGLAVVSLVAAVMLKKLHQRLLKTHSEQAA